jgi:cell shape-determining protein MreC
MQFSTFFLHYYCDIIKITCTKKAWGVTMELLQQIENLRTTMINRAMEIGSFTDEEIITLSQQLDELIIKEQKEKQLKQENSREAP